MSILRDTMLGFEKQKAVLVNYYSEELFNPFEIREKVSFGFRTRCTAARK